MEDVNQKVKQYCSCKEESVAREKKSVKVRVKSKSSERYVSLCSLQQAFVTPHWGLVFTVYRLLLTQKATINYT